MNRLHTNTGCSILVLLALGAAGCGFPGRPNPAERPKPPDRVLAFDALYGQNSAGCHGPDGKMGPAPPLNDKLFRAIVPATTVEEVVAGGRPGTLMPAFSKEHGGPLTPAQVAVLANEIKGIPYRVIEKETDGSTSAFEVVRDPAGMAPTWGLPGPAPEDAPPYLAPKDGAGDAGAGRDKFRAACASCHGDHGQGAPKEGRPPLVLIDPAFLSLVSDQLLRRIAITGRKDLGMPDYAHHDKGALTPADVTNLVAFLRSQGGAASQPRPEPEVSRETHHE